MESEEHLFISDVHLGAFDKITEATIESDLESLIRYATTRKSRIYILGDLFDYWMEFPGSDFKPNIGNRILEAFKKYNQEVSSAIYITGNHDNWTIDYFETLGFDVEADYRMINAMDKRILLMHGDGKLNIDLSISRPMLHRILRSNLFLFFYRSLLPKKWAIYLMKVFSNTSRKVDRRSPIPLSNNAQLLLENEKSDVVLCGHDHIPRKETFNSGLYINLGTFFHHRTLVRGFNGVLTLVQWDAKTQQFNEFKSQR